MLASVRKPVYHYDRVTPFTVRFGTELDGGQLLLAHRDAFRGYVPVSSWI
jgi:hypothetical protein